MNRVTLIGRLGQEPETRYSPSGTEVVTLSLATSDKWLDKDKKWQEKTEWHKVAAFKKQATIAKELTKGSLCYVEGKIQTHKYKDKTGQERQSVSILAQEIHAMASAEKPKQEYMQQKPLPQMAQPSFQEEDIPF
jgi:single-strand DNA-binding protein